MVQKTMSEQVSQVLDELKQHLKVPIGISNKHIHITKEAFEKLFPGQELTVKKMLNQPGEFASNQVLTVVGPKGELKNVRILGPFRKESQVELSLTDARQIGLKIPIRLSGDIEGSSEVILKSNHGELKISKGAIAAKRHIHMSYEDAKLLKLEAGQTVVVKIDSENRSLIFDDCVIRTGKDLNIEMHIDTDEANAFGAISNVYGRIIG